ncbi:rCG58917, isoform CRA_a [Rattus norvegicus]|uniref:RCG58917, isoform CRA_a n=1 Tax=Rattus norvegicus TaxID=10116 RepID=A6KQ48_RAT|nr:rCG58917, isoform CRA_a [Rattus norvegicus]EDL74973.1 rCG58917, isoform CRA_a [Rattus norvegicus]
MQIHTVRHWMEVGHTCEKFGKRIEGPEGDRNSTGRPTDSTKLDCWEISETEPPTKELTQ